MEILSTYQAQREAYWLASFLVRRALDEGWDISGRYPDPIECWRVKNGLEAVATELAAKGWRARDEDEPDLKTPAAPARGPDHEKAAP